MRTSRPANHACRPGEVRASGRGATRCSALDFPGQLRECAETDRPRIEQTRTMMCLSHTQNDWLEMLRKSMFPGLPQPHTPRVEFGSESLNRHVPLACSLELVDVLARHGIRCRELRVKITFRSIQGSKLWCISLHRNPCLFQLPTRRTSSYQQDPHGARKVARPTPASQKEMSASTAALTETQPSAAISSPRCPALSAR